MKWEFDILYALQKIHQPVLDHIMTGLSTIGNAGIFWIVLGLALCIPKKYRKIGIQMVISMAITFIIGNLILKNLIARPRPCWLDTQIALLIKSPKNSGSDFSITDCVFQTVSLCSFSDRCNGGNFNRYDRGNSGACGLSEMEAQTFFVIFNIF